MLRNYRVHGLTLGLPFASDLLDSAAPGAEADVVVRAGEVPDTLAEAEIRRDDHDVDAATFLLRGGARSARFLVEDGRRVTFHKSAACEESLFLHHLLYPVMAALLRQRRLLVFHASAAVIDGRAVLVTGASGAGKSTTTARLMTLGHAVQSDDVTAVRLGEDGLSVSPGARHLHLDDPATDGLGLADDRFTRHAWHRMKMAVPAPLPVRREAVPLGGIVHLQTADVPRPEACRLAGGAKLPLLLRALYGPYLPQQIHHRSALLARVLSDVPFLSIVRPARGWSIDDVADTIVATYAATDRAAAGSTQEHAAQ